MNDWTPVRELRTALETQFCIGHSEAENMIEFLARKGALRLRANWIESVPLANLPVYSERVWEGLVEPLIIEASDIDFDAGTIALFYTENDGSFRERLGSQLTAAAADCSIIWPMGREQTSEVFAANLPIETRGRKKTVRVRVLHEMRALAPADLMALQDEKHEHLADRFKAHRSTCLAALRDALSGIAAN